VAKQYGVYSVLVDGEVVATSENREDAVHRFEEAAKGSFSEAVRLMREQLLAEATKGVVKKKHYRPGKAKAKKA
jgi:hypothetical protein